MCRIRTTTEEEISRFTFESEIQRPVASLLRERDWVDRIHYIVTTSGVPLKIHGKLGLEGDAASVDSELATLYQILKGTTPDRLGPLENPYYRSDRAFSHPAFPMYLVTRLAGYTFADIRGMIDRAQAPVNRGIVVLDLKSFDLNDGNYWLRQAANRLPEKRVLLEESGSVVNGARGVIGFASWGSNDPNRKGRATGFGWLAGAIATEYVSTDGRTFEQPPADWKPGKWENKGSYFAGSPQSLTADLIHEGVTGASGHVYEPYLGFTPRPHYLFEAYVLRGRNLAESFYAALPALSWMNIVVGDPLCKLQPPGK